MPGRISLKITDLPPNLNICNSAAAFHQIFNQAVHFSNTVGMNLSHAFPPDDMQTPRTLQHYRNCNGYPEPRL